VFESALAAVLAHLASRPELASACGCNSEVGKMALGSELALFAGCPVFASACGFRIYQGWWRPKGRARWGVDSVVK
jgi:hypothetical protein